MEDIDGNAYADKMAGLAATKYKVSLNASSHYLYYVSLTKRIQLRLATILMHLPNRPKPAKVPKEPRPELSQLFTQSSHVLYEEEDRVACARCRSRFFKQDPALRHWLSTQCTQIGADHDRPVPMPLEQIHVGRSISHHTHALHTYRGLIFCNKCGSRAADNQLRNLRKVCTPPATKYAYGAVALAALRAGKYPPNLTAWPAEASK